MVQLFTLITLLAPPFFLTSALIPKVLYESNRILAIEKPPGISHHNDEQTGELGIVSQLRLHYNDDNETTSSLVHSNNNSNTTRLYGVHRLDRVTSGILLFAKDPEMAGILSGAFRDNQVVKYYVGLSNMKPKKKKQGWVKGNMVRGRRKSWYLTREGHDTSSSNSNYAVTRFFTAGLGGLDDYRLRDDNMDSDDKVRESHKPATCLLFRPHTGKTHQLRVASKSVGLPLMGDPIYGDSDACSRTLLHATAIHLPLENIEGGHNPVTIWCPPPFAELLWDNRGNDAFEHILDNMLQKHCECPEILDEMRRGTKETNVARPKILAQ